MKIVFWYRSGNPIMWRGFPFDWAERFGYAQYKHCFPAADTIVLIDPEHGLEHLGEVEDCDLFINMDTSAGANAWDVGDETLLKIKKMAPSSAKFVSIPDILGCDYYKAFGHGKRSDYYDGYICFNSGFYAVQMEMLLGRPCVSITPPANIEYLADCHREITSHRATLNYPDDIEERWFVGSKVEEGGLRNPSLNFAVLKAMGLKGIGVCDSPILWDRFVERPDFIYFPIQEHAEWAKLIGQCAGVINFHDRWGLGRVVPIAWMQGVPSIGDGTPYQNLYQPLNVGKFGHGRIMEQYAHELFKKPRPPATIKMLLEHRSDALIDMQTFLGRL